MQAARKIFGNAAGSAGALATVVTFVTDVLQPLGNFAPWVAGGSLVVTLVSGAGYWRHWRTPGVDRAEHPLLGIFLLSAVFTLFFGGWSFIEANGPKNGYLAANVDPIAQLQAQVLGLQKDVSEVKKTTQASATTIASSATVQAVAATTQAQGFQDIQAAFARLSSQGTLSPNPQTPQEWYANARVYQLKGDTANAIRAYEGFLGFRLEYVDPYLEYTALLRASDGIARARQAIDDLRRLNTNSQTLELIQVRLLDSPSGRQQRLAALAARAPQFGPVFNELGQEYDRALAATVTSDLLTKEQDAYAALFKLEEQQGFSRYYIDKALADKQIQTAHTLRAGYANAGTALSNVDVQLYYYTNGVQFIVILPEVFNAKQLLFSVDDPQPKIDAGRIGAGAQMFVNTSIGPIPLPVGDHTFYMQYLDANSVLSKVTSKKVRVEPLAINFQQQPPDFSTNTIPGVFTLGVLGTQGFEQYRYDYSIDSDKLEKSQAGPAFTALNVTGLTRGDHTLYVRATAAADGKQTPVVKLPFIVK